MQFDIDYFGMLLPQRDVSADPRYRSGVFYSDKCGRYIQYESGRELEFIKLLEISDKVRFYVEQPVKIPYKRGRRKLNYVPDFGVYLRSGEFIIVEIKELNAMLEDRVQVKMEGLMEFCSKRGFGLLLTDGKAAFDELKKIPLNRKLEKEILQALGKEPVRKDTCCEIIKRCGATHNQLLAVILKHDLYYTAFPFRLKRGGYNPRFRKVFFEGQKYEDCAW